jgi:hypothetical protein
VPLDDAQGAPKALAHGLDGRIRGDAEGALEICVLDQRDASVGRAFHMIVIVDFWERSHVKTRLSVVARGTKPTMCAGSNKGGARRSPEADRSLRRNIRCSGAWAFSPH